jgi:hypothetical protein
VEAAPQVWSEKVFGAVFGGACNLEQGEGINKLAQVICQTDFAVYRVDGGGVIDA